MRLPCGALDFWPAGPWEINASGSSPWTSKSLRKQRTWVSSQTPVAGRKWQRRNRVRGLAGHRKAGRKEPRVGPGQTWRPGAGPVFTWFCGQQESQEAIF